MAKPTIIGSYDDVADVAYISIGEPLKRARYVEDDRGVVWRVSVDGEKRGVTLLNYSRNWAHRTDELLKLLLANLPLGRREAVEKKIHEFA